MSGEKTRRLFIASGAAAMGAWPRAGLATEATAAALSFPGDPTDRYWTMFADNLSRAGAGITLRLLTRGELGSEEQILPATRRGRVQLAGFTSSGLEALIPEFGLLLAPFLFSSFAETDFVLDRYLAEPFSDLCARQGLIMLTWYDEGWRSLYSKNPLPAPAAARGMRLRALQARASRAFLAALGADVIPMPFPEVVPGLQTGLIAGGEIGAYMYAVSGVATEAPHYTLTRHAYSTGIIAANKDWFDRLSDADRAAVRAATPPAMTARRMMREAAENDLDHVRTQGATVRDVDDTERAAWASAVAGTHAALVSDIGGAAARLYALIEKGKRDYNSR
jgi:TRAP-type C4-dicarboxylate transport system substrate-binding protein